ncbi:MAG: ATP-binding cassette, subfamily bacterial MsbA, partial [Actinomycetota bacterium]
MHGAPSTVREVARLGLPLMRRYRRLLPAILALGIGTSIAEGIGISLFIPLLDTVVDRNQVGHGALPQLFASLLDGLSHDTRLTIVCAALLASVVLRAALGYTNNALWAHLYAHISHDLRTRVHGRLLDARYGWLVRHDEGRLLNALSNETWNATDAIRTLTRMAITSSMIVVYVVLLTLLSWQRTILVGLALVLISAAVRRITRRVAAMSVEVTKANGVLAGRML